MQDQTPGDPFFPEPSPRDSSSAIGESEMGFIKYGNDQLQIVRVLSGGMGEVYICKPFSEISEISEDPPYLSISGNPMYIALKTFQKRLFFHRAAREAFEREVRIWIQLSSIPFILPAYNLIYYDNRPFVSMPAIVPPEGTTVRILLNQGPLPRTLVYSLYKYSKMAD